MDRPRQPLHSRDNYIYPAEDTTREYLKLLGVFAGIGLLSLILTFGRGMAAKYYWQDFIAVLLIVSAAHKMFKLDLFAKIYQSVDGIAHRFSSWSYAFPFILVVLGADYLMSNGSTFLYFMTILITGLAVGGFFLKPKPETHAQYACLDTRIQLSLVSINFVSNLIVLLLAIFMLIVYG